MGLLALEEKERGTTSSGEEIIDHLEETGEGCRPEKKVQIIIVCCILHNFLVERRLESDTRLLDEVDAELMTAEHEEEIMKKSNENSSIKSERSYIHWTLQMDASLSNVLLEQRNMGHKTPNGWKSTAFTATISTFKEICNVDLNKEKITAHLKTWNKYYHDVSVMLDTSGFGWD
ncbi:hypothetical protein KSP39_PZI020272 [Platanthera zijinensis]|uniref:Myb/SANT-like domain-containing protein n=1 Tax=Platanthera zijinensis TaxID=2320716 RepID=A0AAP0AZQ8_9ASPA